MRKTGKFGLYGMPISESTGIGTLFSSYPKFYASEDFKLAKCPICKKQMTYRSNVFAIEFACENKKCRGYYLWLDSWGLTPMGHIGIRV